jgi:hypothetical protein
MEGRYDPGKASRGGPRGGRGRWLGAQGRTATASGSRGLTRPQQASPDP